VHLGLDVVLELVGVDAAVAQVSEQRLDVMLGLRLRLGAVLVEVVARDAGDAREMSVSGRPPSPVTAAS
jgi:hypothetical protein